MKTVFRLTLLLCSLLSLTFPAQAERGLSVEEAQAFLNDSGMDALIEMLPSAMEQQLNLQRLSQANQLQFEEAQQAIMQAIESVQGNELALGYLTTNADTQNLKTAIQFLNSPLGKRITAEERAASGLDAQLEMQAYSLQLAKTPPTEQRIQLIQSLTQALSADEVMLNLVKGVFYSMLDITEGLSPDASAKLKQDLDSEWQQMEPVMRDKFSQLMLMSAYYSYRNLPDEDLKQYIDFLNTESGQAYWKSSLKIIDLYLNAFAKELVAIIKQDRD